MCRRCAASICAVKPGEFLSIVGPSGSGKSTLFHIIGGAHPAHRRDRCSVAGQDLAHMTDAGRTRLRKSTVGFVFQKFNLLPNLTARDNIAVARFIAGMDQKPDPAFEEVLRAARHRPPPGPQAQRAFRRRAAARRHRARHRQSSGDSAGRRAHRQPGHREFPGRAGHSARPEPAPRPDHPHDHAQSRGGSLRHISTVHMRDGRIV